MQYEPALSAALKAWSRNLTNRLFLCVYRVYPPKVFYYTYRSVDELGQLSKIDVAISFYSGAHHRFIAEHITLVWNISFECSGGARKAVDEFGRLGWFSISIDMILCAFLMCFLCRRLSPMWFHGFRGFLMLPCVLLCFTMVPYVVLCLHVLGYVHQCCFVGFQDFHRILFCFPMGLLASRFMIFRIPLEALSKKTHNAVTFAAPIETRPPASSLS